MTDEPKNEKPDDEELPLNPVLARLKALGFRVKEVPPPKETRIRIFLRNPAPRKVQPSTKEKEPSQDDL